MTRQPRKTEADYHALANQRGYKWMGTTLPNVNVNTEWECDNGHRFFNSYTNVNDARSKTACTYCDPHRPKTAWDYANLAREHNLIWVGPMVDTVTAKTQWMCSNSHTFWMHYNNIRNGKGCKQCFLDRSAERTRRPIGDYYELAAQRNLQFNGPEVLNVDTLTSWTCLTCGYEWETTYYQVKVTKACPRCSRVEPKSGQHYHQAAEVVNAYWVGDVVPRTAHEKTSWKCRDCGHVWVSDFNTIGYKHSKCPECTGFVNGIKTSAQQRDIAAMVDGELNYRHGRYYIDIALRIDNTPIAIEYNGWYYHRERQKEDEQRRVDLITDGWHVLYINGNTALPTEDELIAAIVRLTQGEKYVEITLPDWQG